MSLLNSQQENSITAFIAALRQQDEALPAGLQKQLHAIGQIVGPTDLPTDRVRTPRIYIKWHS
ncbi:MAG: hypothetical protein AAF959_07310 [Cyanobacteria bacterium P01_D01_bin.56]